jgi:diacylglycerol diphosphate phosphatase/phosphatidate phosphatase
LAVCEFLRGDETDEKQLIGLGYALATSTLFNSFLKLFVGGLRPHFLTICAPINPPSFQGLASTSKTDMRFYTAAQVCTGPSRRVREAQMSFPSGHASAAFAGFVFLALYLNAKYKVLSRGTHFRDSYGERQTSAEEEVTGTRVHHWKLVLFVVPWCIALVLALSKIRDRWHHPVDVVFGALLGTLFAHMAFKMVYWSVYDARTNHIPLGEKEEGMNANEEGKSAKEEGESAKEGKEV